MKKILLFALPLLAMIAVSCEKDNGELSGDDIIEFKDPNFLKALLTDGWAYAETDDEFPMNVDANKDGKISVNEAQKVKVLYLSDDVTEESYDIKDISEIKYFTALIWLGCSNNQLTTLDLSKNTALKCLACDNNKLTTLDLSGCTALTDLSYENNPLTKIILPTIHSLGDATIQEITDEYGNIIEYR